MTPTVAVTRMACSLTGLFDASISWNAVALEASQRGDPSAALRTGGNYKGIRCAKGKRGICSEMVIRGIGSVKDGSQAVRMSEAL